MFEKEYRINRAWGLQIGCMYSAIEKFSFTGFSDYPFITEGMTQTLLRLQDDRKNKFNFPSVHEDRELRIMVVTGSLALTQELSTQRLCGSLKRREVHADSNNLSLIIDIWFGITFVLNLL